MSVQEIMVNNSQLDNSGNTIGHIDGYFKDLYCENINIGGSAGGGTLCSQTGIYSYPPQTPDGSSFNTVFKLIAPESIQPGIQLLYEPIPLSGVKQGSLYEFEVGSYFDSSVVSGAGNVSTISVFIVIGVNAPVELKFNANLLPTTVGAGTKYFIVANIKLQVLSDVVGGSCNVSSIGTLTINPAYDYSLPTPSGTGGFTISAAQTYNLVALTGDLEYVLTLQTYSANLDLLANCYRIFASARQLA
jgi:hypothetical protein